MTRRTLPNRREAETFGIMYANNQYTVSVGYFSRGEVMPTGPAEVFISGTKAGSDVEAVARDGAVILSISLQHGVPLDVIARAITRGQNGEPLTIVGAVIDQLMKRQT